MSFATEALEIVGILVGVLILALAVVVIAPWKGRSEALDPEVEARLLLGEDPDEIDRDLQRDDADSAPVADLRGDE